MKINIEIELDNIVKNMLENGDNYIEVLEKLGLTSYLNINNIIESILAKDNSYIAVMDELSISSEHLLNMINLVKLDGVQEYNKGIEKQTLNDKKEYLRSLGVDVLLISDDQVEWLCTPIKEFKEVYNKLRTVSKVAKHYGTSKNNIERYLVTHKISLDIIKYNKEILIDDYVNGISINELIPKYDISKVNLVKMLREAKVYREYSRPDKSINDAKIIELYKEGMKISKIARVVGMQGVSVTRRLRKLGYDIRDISLASDKELTIINSFKESGNIGKTTRELKTTRILVESTLLKYGIPYGKKE